MRLPDGMRIETQYYQEAPFPQGMFFHNYPTKTSLNEVTFNKKKAGWNRCPSQL
jgi:hypothetical protein